MARILVLLLFILTVQRSSVLDMSKVVFSKLEHNDPLIIVNKSHCSVSCGIGWLWQSLCILTPAGTYSSCWQQQVECHTSWHCGIRLQTVVEGKSTLLKCLVGEEHVAEIPRRYRFMYMWFWARGLVTTNDKLFSSSRLPKAQNVTLKATREAHAGTYRCDVLDVSQQLIHRAYIGLKVLPRGIVDLKEWNSTDITNGTTVHKVEPVMDLLEIIAFALSLSAAAATIIFLVLCCYFRIRFRESPAQQ